MADDLSLGGGGGPDAVRDLDAAHPVAGDWRPIFTELLSRFRGGDFACRAGVRGVAPISDATAEQMRASVAAYGATLILPPKATWETSVAQWMGSHWDVLIDLWSAEEGRTDLVLDARVQLVGEDPLVTVHAIYVP